MAINAKLSDNISEVKKNWNAEQYNLQNQGHTMLGVLGSQLLPQLLANGAESLGSRLANSGRNSHSSKAPENKTVEELEADKQDLLSKISVNVNGTTTTASSTDDFNKVQQAALDEIQSLSSQLNGETNEAGGIGNLTQLLEGKVDGKVKNLTEELNGSAGGRIAELQAQLQNATDENERANIQTQIGDMQTKIKNEIEAEQNIIKGQIQTKQTELQGKIQDLQTQYSDASQLMQMVLDIDEQIRIAKGGEVEDHAGLLKGFVSAADGFRQAMANPGKDNANLIAKAKDFYAAYNSLGVDKPKSAENLYNLYADDARYVLDNKDVTGKMGTGEARINADRKKFGL